MQKLIHTLGLALLAVSLAGCHFIYRPSVQQGNVLDMKDITQLHPDMTKRQVLALLGSPSVLSPFNQNEWYYVNTKQRRGGPVHIRTLRLTFNNDTLVHFEGDKGEPNINTQMLTENAKQYRARYLANDASGDKKIGDSSDKGGDSGGGDDSGGGGN